ncbi:MAG: polysaccharide deacetylase family protein [Flavobacteriales bacterium]|nr:polysaccharide deacetylase family protein [Flavobacteriales bacterium]
MKYQIENHELNTYTITIGKNTLTSENKLFNGSEKDSYISTENLPSPPLSCDYQHLGINLPVLYGNCDFSCTSNETKFGSDIFGACFFMLTRWEEIIDQNKDVHGRVQAKNAIAYKWHFLNRPIVDEYVDLIWNCLVHLGYKGIRKPNQYELIITHDVDEIQKWDGSSAKVKTIAGDLLKRKSIKLAQANLRQIKSAKKGDINDPYDTFDELMDLSEKKGVKSHFFFLHYGTHENDQNYHWDNPNVVNAIDKIKARSHHIGLHPSYNAHTNAELFHQEKMEFEANFNISPTTGRQHYLRFETPETWQIWEDNNMEWDSSMYYSEQLGFRCGTCRDFPVFNVKTRKTLNLKELPMTFMDSSFFKRIESGEFESLLTELQHYSDIIKQHKGKFVLLWHTNYLNLHVFKKHKEFYVELLKLL